MMVRGTATAGLSRSGWLGVLLVLSCTLGTAGLVAGAGAAGVARRTAGGGVGAFESRGGLEADRGGDALSDVADREEDGLYGEGGGDFGDPRPARGRRRAPPPSAVHGGAGGYGTRMTRQAFLQLGRLLGVPSKRQAKGDRGVGRGGVANAHAPGDSARGRKGGDGGGGGGGAVRFMEAPDVAPRPSTGGAVNNGEAQDAQDAREAQPAENDGAAGFGGAGGAGGAGGGVGAAEDAGGGAGGGVGGAGDETAGTSPAGSCGAPGSALYVDPSRRSHSRWDVRLEKAGGVDPYSAKPNTKKKCVVRVELSPGLTLRCPDCSVDRIASVISQPEPLLPPRPPPKCAEPDSLGPGVTTTCKDGEDVGTRCEFGCQVGHTLSGVPESTCDVVAGQNKAEYRGHSVKCEPATCGEPKPLGPGVTTTCAHGGALGTRCDFGCEPGFKMSGLRKSTCSPCAATAAASTLVPDEGGEDGGAAGGGSGRRGPSARETSLQRIRDTRSSARLNRARSRQT